MVPWQGRILAWLSCVLLMLPASAWAGSPGLAPLPTNAQAWRNLPPAEEGSGQPLPVWIRALSTALPQTAAAMLELDYTQRAKNPLPAQLRAQLRWMAAHANRCPYTQACARADFLRAGGRAEDIDHLLEQLDQLPEAPRLALRFAQQLTEAAYTITDAQVARLVRLHGEKQVVAIVLVAAYANFQDRLVLGLGITEEPGGPLPPVRVKFHKLSRPAAPSPKDRAAVAAKKPPSTRIPYHATNRPPVPWKVEDPEWTAVPFAALQEQLHHQIQRRQARIAIPSWEAIRKTYPTDLPLPQKPIRILWSRLCQGYQPRLASAWIAGLRAFQSEGHLDEVYSESVFWVVTRSLQCFY